MATDPELLRMEEELQERVAALDFEEAVRLRDAIAAQKAQLESRSQRKAPEAELAATDGANYSGNKGNHRGHRRKKAERKETPDQKPGLQRAEDLGSVSSCPAGTTASEVRKRGCEHTFLFTKARFGSGAEAGNGSPATSAQLLRLLSAKRVKEAEENEQPPGESERPKTGYEKRDAGPIPRLSAGLPKGTLEQKLERQRQEDLRTVFVSGCPKIITKSVIRSHFPQAEDIAFVRKGCVSTTKVRFGSRPEAEAASKMDVSIDGQRVVLTLGSMAPVSWTGEAKGCPRAGAPVEDSGGKSRGLQTETKPELQKEKELPTVGAPSCPSNTTELGSKDRGEMEEDTTEDEADVPTVKGAAPTIPPSTAPPAVAQSDSAEDTKKGTEVASEDEDSDSDGGDSAQNPQKGTEVASEDEDSDSDDGSVSGTGLPTETPDQMPKPNKEEDPPTAVTNGSPVGTTQPESKDREETEDDSTEDEADEPMVKDSAVKAPARTAPPAGSRSDLTEEAKKAKPKETVKDAHTEARGLETLERKLARRKEEDQRTVFVHGGPPDTTIAEISQPFPKASSVAKLPNPLIGMMAKVGFATRADAETASKQLVTLRGVQVDLRLGSAKESNKPVVVDSVEDRGSAKEAKKPEVAPSSEDTGPLKKSKKHKSLSSSGIVGWKSKGKKRKGETSAEGNGAAGGEVPAPKKAKGALKK